MQVLVSPTSVSEASSLLSSGAAMVMSTRFGILDVKNVKEGSLGAQYPWNTRKIVNLTQPHQIKTSATLGDLPYKPGTAALAAYGLAHCGVTYIKAGLYGVNTYKQARERMYAIRRATYMVSKDIDVVASGYADYRRFDGLSIHDLVKAAIDAKCNVVMVDTAIKDGKTLFDVLSLNELEEFIGRAHEAGLRVALAGSLKFEHADTLRKLNPDIIGVRGAVCEGKDRNTRMSPEKTKHFIKLFEQN